MLVRSFVKAGPVPAVAAGLLLFTLAGASLGCAYAACYGVADAPQFDAGHPKVVPLITAPARRPVAGVADHGRCAGARSARTRRAICRAADLSAV